MRKIIVLLILLSLVFISGCNDLTNDLTLYESADINYDCVIGCWRGMNYNGSEFILVETTSISSQKLINDCRTMCLERVNGPQDGEE